LTSKTAMDGCSAKITPMDQKNPTFARGHARPFATREGTTRKGIILDLVSLATVEMPESHSRSDKRRCIHA